MPRYGQSWEGTAGTRFYFRVQELLDLVQIHVYIYIYGSCPKTP